METQGGIGKAAEDFIIEIVEKDLAVYQKPANMRLTSV